MKNKESIRSDKSVHFLDYANGFTVHTYAKTYYYILKGTVYYVAVIFQRAIIK